MTAGTNGDKRNVTQKSMFHEGGIHSSADIADVCTTGEKVCTTVQTIICTILYICIIQPTILVEPTVVKMGDSR